MLDIPSENIKELFKEFSAIVDYNDKLIFFDNYFGLIPFKFPFFQPGVDILMKGEEINLLIRIFEEERKMTAHYLVRSVIHENKEYLFNIAPVNYNRQIFNDFVIERFQSTDKGYTESIDKARLLAAQSKYAMGITVKEAKDLANLISQKIKSQAERSFRHQFLNVFYNGYIDYQSTFIKRFPSKKKLIELYLYAQGILFARYIATLENMSSDAADDLIENSENFTGEWIGLEKKISLLCKYGIIKYLSDKPSSEFQITDLIVDLFDAKRETVQKILNTMNIKEIDS